VPEQICQAQCLLFALLHMEIFLFVPNHDRFFYSRLKKGTKRGFDVSAPLLHHYPRDASFHCFGCCFSPKSNQDESKQKISNMKIQQDRT
jgi:hypothetical protein